MHIKILTLLSIIIMITGSVGAVALNREGNTTVEILTKNIHFSQATMVGKDSYLSVQVDEASSYLKEPGFPMVPQHIERFTFPFGTKIKTIEYTPSLIHQDYIAGKIQPAPKPIPLISQKTSAQGEIVTQEIVEENEVYTSSDLYPDSWYSYRIGCGLDNGDHVLFLTIYCYPIRYAPADNKIQRITSADITIQYEKPYHTVTYNNEYDLVIITPNGFSRKLQPLVNHKNEYGIATKLVTLNEIYRGSYFPVEGRDNQEKIKYFIKNAIENWDITYVLLVGGKKGQLFNWHIPVRYSHLEDNGGFYEPIFISDLYYADVYKYNEYSGEYEFDDWDTNGDGLFAEWNYSSFYPEDELDLYPDVYIGRLACRNTYEVATVVKKIITYETSVYSAEWFTNMILVGGDTVPSNSDYFEGEIETNLAASYIEPLGFSIIKLWSSDGSLSSVSDIISAFRNGAGFAYFTGHGSPITWSTHPPHSDEWVCDLYVWNMNRLKNRNKLPVCVVGGCHNSQFDVSLSNIIKGVREQGLKYFIFSYDRDCFGKFTWYPECWSWHLVRQRNGGTIATIGNTGLGYGVGGESSVDYYDGWIATHFFEVYGVQGKRFLGEVHGTTVTDYVIEFCSSDRDWTDWKTAQQWTLLGDPSLLIGGYQTE